MKDWMYYVMKSDALGLTKKIKDGLDITSTDLNSSNVLHHLPFFYKNTEEELFPIVKLAVEKGININQINKDGKVAINQNVFVRQYSNIAWYLIENGANFEHLDREGNNILTWALMNGKSSLVHKLINLGMDINHTNFKNIHYCIYSISDKKTKRNIIIHLDMYYDSLNKLQKNYVDKERLRALF